MTRRLSNALLALSLLLCAATAAFWLRSLHTCDSVARGQLNDAGYSLATFPGGVEFTAAGGLSGAWFGIWQPGWHRSSFGWGTPRFKFTMTSGMIALGIGLAEWTKPSHDLLGFGFESTTQTTPAPIAGFSSTHSITRVAAPFWFLMFLLSMPSLMWLGRRWRRVVRRRQQRCVECGYDLRGTPEGCPECGTSACPERSTYSCAVEGNSREVNEAL